MISNNFVTGDNIYLRELQNFFFEVLGMMSITHYGAIGDGRTDNYAYLQVAIDDAHRRHLNYIYVPYGRYRYRGNLINIGDLKFVGNPHAKIYNDRTGEEIEILQFGVCTGKRGGEMNIRELTSPLNLVDGTPPTLEEGLYFTGPNVVFVNGSGANNVAFGSDELFYYDEDRQTLAGFLYALAYLDPAWSIARHDFVSDTIENKRDKIPSLKAVYDALQNVSPQPSMDISAITAQLDDDYEAHSDVEYAVPLVATATVGTGLTVDNGAVVVGSGISKVKVSVFANVWADTAGNTKLTLMLNSFGVAHATKGLEAEEKDTLSIPCIVLEVSENDTLYPKVKLGNGDIVYGNAGAMFSGEAGTFMTVEAIG